MQASIFRTTGGIKTVGFYRTLS